MKTPHASNEFLKEGMSEWDPSLDRRDFLKLSSAALALAGLSACIKPPLEKMFSYVGQPEDLIPGEPQFFATHYTLGGLANGLLVETHEGRPTKIEGNPSHPANLGAASAIHQALVLSLYHPDRTQNVLHQGSVSSFLAFTESLKTKLEEIRKNQGEGFAILTEVSSSEVMKSQRDELLHQYPKARWVSYEPLMNDSAETASVQVFGQKLTPVYDLKKPNLIVSVDSNFLAHPHSPLVYAKDFADRPDLKLYSIESSGSLTGVKASRRLGVKPSRVDVITQFLAHSLLGTGQSLDPFNPPEKTFLLDLIGKIKTAGKVLFIPGEHQSRQVHAICALLNERYAKDSVSYVPSLFSQETAEFKMLTQQMNEGKIHSLFILGGNPSFHAPGYLNFGAGLKKVEFSVHLSLDENETNEEVSWVIPHAHPLESWSDAKAFDGRLSFSQPLIAPLYSGLTASELLDLVLSPKPKSQKKLLEEHFQKLWGASFTDRFKSALKTGVTGTKDHSLIHPRPRSKITVSSIPHASSPSAPFEIAFRPDAKIYDGRFSNHPWLQELPDPLTRLTWGNALLLNPIDLKAKNLKTGDEVELSASGVSIRIPVMEDPLQAEGAGTLHFGYGRTRAGIGQGIGVNIYPFWNGDGYLSQVELKKTGVSEELACTQTHHSMESRDLIRSVRPNEKAAKYSDPASLYHADPVTDLDEAWAMVIDLDRCTGCGACVVACQSENNIPSVGKDAVRMGREMHWIRVDRYFEDTNPGNTHFQPVPCMHCEKAPCEPVCPTGATVHGSGGLNQMVYNRCVGTRYCSNNCPYKVRRFNFLTYNDKNSKLSARQKNPNVSVRTRGVMEKCTYCTQRITAARIQSRREDRKIRDGEIKTACQATCPSHAIEFGNLRDQTSAVWKLKQDPRNYGLLEELGTRPRTTYLAKVKRKDA